MRHYKQKTITNLKESHQNTVNHSKSQQQRKEHTGLEWFHYREIVYIHYGRGDLLLTTENKRELQIDMEAKTLEEDISRKSLLIFLQNK